MLYASVTAWRNVGNVTLNYPRGNLWINRASIKGFTTQAGVTNCVLVDSVWMFDYPLASLHWELQVDSRFFPPSTNTYSMSYVIDLANSWSYQSGIPTPTTIDFGLMYIAGEGLPRLGTLPGSMGDPLERADLQPYPNYWLPT